MLTSPRTAYDYWYDVSGDGVLSVVDANQVIDYVGGGSGAVGAPWRNPALPQDVNNDGPVTVADVQAIQDYLNLGAIDYTALALDQIHIRTHGGNDVVTADGAIAWLFGGWGNDMLTGGGGADLIDGGMDDDNLNGGDGNDTLTGAAGGDALDGGDGTDTVDYSDSVAGVTANLSSGYFGAGGDAEGDTFIATGGNTSIENIVGSAYADVLTGNTLANTIDGGDGDDEISGGEGNDELHGDSGNDTINADNGDDLLYGDAGDDTLNGGEGDDYLIAGEGVNALFGGPGNDTLDGDAQADVMLEDGDSRQPVADHWWISPDDLEGTTVTVMVGRSLNSGPGALTLTVQTVDGTARDGIDYQGGTFIVTIAANAEYSDPFSIHLLHDDIIQSDAKTYRLQITDVQGGAWANPDFPYAEMYINDASIKANDDATVVTNDDPVVLGVLGNDHWGPQNLHIAFFTQPAHGVVNAIYDSDGQIDDLTFIRDPNYPEESQAFTYAAADDQGQQSTANVDIFPLGVHLVGMDVEEQWWGDDPDIWRPESYPLWGNDEHRWSTQVVPAAAASQVESIAWYAEPYVGQSEPIGNGQVFAMSQGAGPAIGSPGVGFWYIYPIATLPGFLQVQGDGQQRVGDAIVSVTWVGFDPGDGQTNLVDGMKIYPERNTPECTPPLFGPLHDRVSVEVTIAMPLPDSVTIHARVLDPDNVQYGAADPNDTEIGMDVGWIPEGDDNNAGSLNPPPPYKHAIGIDEENFTIPIASGQTTGSVVRNITEPQPGNNFEVVVSPHNDLGRVSLDSDYATSPVVFVRGVEQAYPGNRVSAVLEVWRTLWVELDHMGAPGAGEVFDGDDESAAPASPEIGTLRDLVSAAHIEVRSLPDEFNETREIPFQHYILQAGGNWDTAGRDEYSEQGFWVVRAVGAYEYSEDWDHDTNFERGLLGISGVPGSDNASHSIYVFWETIRDCSVDWGFDLDAGLSLVTAHEVLHKFLGRHGNPAYPAADDGILAKPTVDSMRAPAPPLMPLQILVIQRLRYPL
ncbi:MAG: hypothetical protein IT427_16345 [Pirellulales bacterium]|nr:hypothetical protein [Pirellulales bacterium]